MDFRNVPNTTSYPSEQPVDITGGISSGSMNLNAYVAATLQEGDEEQSKKTSRKIIIGLIFAFAILSIGGVGFFFYQNSQQAAASSNDNPYENLVVEVSSVPKTPIPSPTHLLPSVALTPTLAPGQTDPNLPTPIVYATDTVPQPTAKKFGWEITFSKQTYTRADLPGSRPQIVGTMFTPLSKNMYVCISDHHKFFTKKKDETTITRLCDKTTPTPASQVLNCYKYDPTVGLPVAASLYPSENCSSTTTNYPESATYVMAVKAYYNCTLPAGQTSNISISSCTDSKEVFSYDLTYIQ